MRNSPWSTTVLLDGAHLRFYEPGHDWRGAVRSVRQHVLDEANIGSITHDEATDALRLLVDVRMDRELTLTVGRHTYLVRDQSGQVPA